jgi:hypothetical protein
MREKTLVESESLENADILIINERNLFFKELEEISKTPRALWTKDGRLLFEKRLDECLEMYKKAVYSLPIESEERYWRIYRESLKFFDEKLAEDRKFDWFRNWFLCWILLCVRRQMNLTPYLLKYRAKFQAIIPDFKKSRAEEISFSDEDMEKEPNKLSERARTQVIYVGLLRDFVEKHREFSNDDTKIANFFGPLFNIHKKNFRSYINACKNTDMIDEPAKMYLERNGFKLK